jgi:hypothetical protein
MSLARYQLRHPTEAGGLSKRVLPIRELDSKVIIPTAKPRMIIIKIEIKESDPDNVAMQAQGTNVDGVATDAETKVADQIMVGLDSLFRSVGKYTEVRPLRIFARNAPQDKPKRDGEESS